jgi:solute carrier family 25 protein 38
MFNLKDFICGITAGWTQVIIGQPLDYIKIKIQLHPNDHFDIKTFIKEIYHKYGFLGFYRGSSTQFLGQVFTTGF